MLLHKLNNIERPLHSRISSVEHFLIPRLLAAAPNSVSQIAFGQNSLALNCRLFACYAEVLREKLRSEREGGYWSNQLAGQEAEAVKETPDVADPLKQAVGLPFDKCLFLT